VLAFYLPQFHQVPENDAWHGRGFTEWTVVARSRPLYPGHRQPDLPAELGFYDLRVPESRLAQARLAREHGITGFLYYHYWFGGARMLGRPFDEVLRSGQPDFPFALCWANESWYRRWQGSVDEMLMEQTFSEEDDVAHIRWMIEAFRDPRYIRIEGRPLLAVYRAHHLPNPTRTVELWRRECDRAGVEHPWLVMFETDDAEIQPPSRLGFDASAEFVPHFMAQLVQPSEVQASSERSFVAYEYEDVAAGYAHRPAVAWQRYPCVATAWDNSPRRQDGEAIIMRNSTPGAYGRWLAGAARRQLDAAGGDGVVFVNGWNEWAEGAHLEPDAFWGRAYLETTRDVLRAQFGEAGAPTAEPGPERIEQAAPEEMYQDLYDRFVDLQRAHSGYLSYADRRRKELKARYEADVHRERAETRAIADLNQKMAEELQYLAKRLEEVGVSDVPPLSWLIP
jgi:lipopolysaccharide biosynthesis protein